ncbi:hypothetical protein AB7M63_006542 [Bradyrhizobium japonicum]
MMSIIHRSNLAAWIDLQKRGGLELDGRDEGFEEELRSKLDPDATSLTDALRAATTEQFLGAFFDVLQPFVEMFRAILDFFEKARATQGREQWNISVDGTNLSLEHLRHFLKDWDSVPCEIEVPVLDFDSRWRLAEIGRPATSGLPDDNDFSKLTGVSDWLRAYQRGQYEELPSSLRPAKLADGYKDAAGLAITVLKIIRERYTTRNKLIQDHVGRGQYGDAFSLGSIAQNESDHWLWVVVTNLARSTTLPAEARLTLGKELQAFFASYPRKKFGVRLDLDDLGKYLSLPVWKKRHELYAVWIATEILAALPGHRYKIHQENGKILFSFRRTLVATVTSCWPSVELISERRVPIDTAVGRGRKKNVQPDYGLWRREADEEKCGLVIEVKHYKKSAPSSFSDVLTDYARAFPDAEILLVNHGPIGNVLSKLNYHQRARCKTIEKLTATNRQARDELRAKVLTYVGRSHALQTANELGSLKADTVLAIDVSPSMRPYLDQQRFFEIVMETVDERCSDVALIDDKLRSLVRIEELRMALGTVSGRSTALEAPVRWLLGLYKRALIITDEEGADTLQAQFKKTLIPTRTGLVIIEILAD